MEDESSSSSYWLSKLFKKKRKAVLTQKITPDAYKELRAVLMRANPERQGDKVFLKLPRGEVILSREGLKVVAETREDAEKILRNLHYYSMPPGLWPAYGLSYSIKKGTFRAGEG